MLFSLGSTRRVTSLLAAWCLASLCALLLYVSPVLSASGPPAPLLSSAAKDSHGILRLDTASYNALVNQGQDQRKDYSMSILLTALQTPGIDCGPCRAFQPNYEAVAKAWKSRVGTSKWKQGHAKHYFAEVEFSQGKEIFMQLELNHAPVMLFIPPGLPANKAMTYDFNRLGFDALPLSNFLSDLIGEPTGYRKPFPWKSVAIFLVTALVSMSACLFAIARFNAAMEQSSGTADAIGLKTVAGWLLQLVSLATITIMCAGYMWNNIRGSAYLNVSPGGKIEYFAGGFQNQLGVETQIVACIYGVLAFSVVALTLLVPTQRDPTKQRAGVYVWSVIFLAGVSVLFAVFRIKNPSYPFRLFL